MKRNRLWAIGLGLLSALVIIWLGSSPWSWQGRATRPTLELPAVAEQNPEVLAKQLRSQSAPSTSLSPTPGASQPETSSPSVPAAPATAPKIEAREYSAPPLPLSEQTYQDPGKRFEIGILADYKQGTVGAFPLIESPDGSLAYTVVAKSKVTQEPLSYEDMARIAIAPFERGEGFQPEPFRIVGETEVEIPWSGISSSGRNRKNIKGLILARQTDNNVLVLLISTTEGDSSENIEGAIAALAPTFQPL